MNRQVRAELLRLRHTPTVWIIGVLGVGISILGTSLVLSFARIPPGGDITQVMSFSGSGGLMSLLLGVVWAGGDYRHRTIVPVTLLVPRRWPASVAQLLALGLVGTAIGLVSAPATLLTGVIWLGASGTPYHLPVTGMIGAWLGAALHGCLSAAIGGGLGALARNQVAAAIAVFVYLGSIGPLLAQAHPGYGQFGPTALGIVLSGGSPQPGGPGQRLLPAVVAIVVYLGYAVVFAAAGVFAAHRRELP
jgi:hypothetical protein